MFYAGFDLLFSILFPILFLVAFGHDPIHHHRETSVHGIKTTIRRG